MLEWNEIGCDSQLTALRKEACKFASMALCCRVISHTVGRLVWHAIAWNIYRRICWLCIAFLFFLARRTSSEKKGLEKPSHRGRQQRLPGVVRGHLLQISQIHIQRWGIACYTMYYFLLERVDGDNSTRLSPPCPPPLPPPPSPASMH